MLSRQDVINHLKQHPGSTVEELMAWSGRPRTTISSKLSVMFAEGLLNRTIHHRTLTGRPAYAWFAVDQEYVRLPPVRTPSPRQNGTASSQAEPPRKKARSTDTLDSLAEKIADAMVEALMPRVKDKLLLRMQDKVASVMTALPERILERSIADINPPEQEVIVAPKMEKVLIAKLLPQQAGMIISEFNKCFDIDVWDGGNPHSLRRMAQHADKVICMTQFMGHGYDEIIKTHPGYIPVNGGMTSLRETLTKMYVEG